MTEMTDGLEWLRVYWISGVEKRGGRFMNAVANPPCSGWGFVILIRGEKRSTLFCPFTFDAFTVPNDCGEIQAAKLTYAAPARLEKMLRNTWTEMQTRGWTKDYDTCALIFKRMGWTVPEQIMKGGEEDTRKKGGKKASSALKKPVKLKSKRGQFLVWFLDNGQAGSIREAMAEFGMTRSNVLSYLYMLKKDHGIGYELVGDTATLDIPGEDTNPFDEDRKEDNA